MCGMLVYPGDIDRSKGGKIGLNALFNSQVYTLLQCQHITQITA